MHLTRTQLFQSNQGHSLLDHAETFDVAISFTARDPAAGQLAAELHSQLSRMGLKVFYYADIEEAARVLGERLSELLPSIYRDRARFVVIVASPQYGKTFWTKRELRATLKRPDDDAGRKRIAVISADGSMIAALPRDMLHLGSEAVEPESVTAAARLIAARCGVKPGRWRSWWPLALPTAASMPLLAQATLAGSEPSLTPWIVIAALASIALAGMVALVPRVWMARRKAAVGQKLMVVTEGPALTMFRSVSTVAGVAFGLVALALSALCGWTIAEARIAVRDIRALATGGSADEAMRRFSSERVRLASFEAELLPLFEKSISDAMPEEGWLRFPGLYRLFEDIGGTKSPGLEDKFIKTAIGKLREGDDVLDQIQVSFALRPVAPSQAKRLLATSLARTLEWEMSGNDFYYGSNGVRGWAIYAQLRDADGVDEWIKANRKSMLENNPGLAPQIAVYLAIREDASAFDDVLKFLGQNDPDADALAALASASLPSAFRVRITPALAAAWTRLHADERPTPMGFGLAAAYAMQAPAEAEALFLDKAMTSTHEQERAHALNGLYVLVARNSMANGKAVTETLLDKQKSASELEQMAANGQWAGVRACASNAGQSLETELRILLDAKPGQNRTPAGVVPLQVLPGIDAVDVLKKLKAYIIACSASADPLLVTAVRTRYGAETRDVSAIGFTALRERYEAAAKDVPGAAYEPKVLYLVQLLREMGNTGDPAAADFLDSIFDRLPHGNMTIAAAESLLRLRGRFGQVALERVRELVAMKSSVYRPEALEMIGRNADGITDAAERPQIIHSVAVVSISGDASERGQMLDVLSRLDPQLAQRRAFFLTLSNNPEDRLEGIERLWHLWQASEK